MSTVADTSSALVQQVLLLTIYYYLTAMLIIRFHSVIVRESMAKSKYCTIIIKFGDTRDAQSFCPGYK